MSLFLCWAVTPSAQTDRFLQKKRIAWAGIVEQDFVVDAPCYAGDYLNEQQTLKFVHPLEDANIWEGNYLAGVVLQAMEKRQLPFYETDTATEYARDLPDLLRPDTLVSYDPDTYEERIMISHRESPDPETLERWRVRGLLYYDRRRGAWDMRDIRVAPLISVQIANEDETVIDTLVPYYWIDAKRAEPRSGRSRYNWVKYLVPRAPGSFIEPAAATILKEGGKDESPFTAYIQDFASKSNVTYYAGDRFGGGAPLSMEQRRELLAPRDTIETFDPETLEQKITIIRNAITPESFIDLRVIHTWYWDKKRRRLLVDITATAPMLPVMDNRERLRFYRPVFYGR